MQLEDYFDFSIPDAIRIKGHRIWIEHVLAYYHDGYTPDEIAREFPGLSLEKIYATLTYYLAHRAEMDAYLIRIDERDEHDYQEWAKHPSPVVERMRTLQAQRVAEAMQAGAVG